MCNSRLRAAFVIPSANPGPDASLPAQRIVSCSNSLAATTLLYRPMAARSSELVETPGASRSVALVVQTNGGRFLRADEITGVKHFGRLAQSNQPREQERRTHVRSSEPDL